MEGRGEHYTWENLRGWCGWPKCEERQGPYVGGTSRAGVVGPGMRHVRACCSSCVVGRPLRALDIMGGFAGVVWLVLACEESMHKGSSLTFFSKSLR